MEYTKVGEVYYENKKIEIDKTSKIADLDERIAALQQQVTALQAEKAALEAL